MLVKMGSSSPNRGENNKYLKTLPASRLESLGLSLLNSFTKRSQCVSVAHIHRNHRHLGVGGHVSPSSCHDDTQLYAEDKGTF